MKLLFNYLTHSMKESDTLIKSKTSPIKANGAKTGRGNGNSKIKKAKPSTSGAEIKLTNFFNSFKKLNASQVTNGDTTKGNKKQCNSQTNGTPTKRSKAKSTPKSSSSPPLKSSTTPKRGRPASLSTSASASAKKRAIERALQKKDLATKTKQGLDSDESDSDASKKNLCEKLARVEDGKTKRKKASSTSPRVKRARKRVDSNDSEDSEKSRPRRRASQTYIIKYQLARNPLKAEEEDLKQALLASLEQCGQAKITSSKKQQQQLLNDLLLQDQSSNASTSSKTTKHNQRESHHHKQPRKQHPKHPSTNKQTHCKTSSLSISQPTVPVTPASVATSKPPTYDEKYLEKYRPDTEDFLTFICFRVTAPNVPQRQLITGNQQSNEPTANSRSKLLNGYADNNNLSSITGSLNIKIESNNNNIATSSASTTSSYNNDHCPNLRRSVSPSKSNSNSTSSVASNQLSSPSSNRRRPPTRQSPRLACSTQQQQHQQHQQQQQLKISDMIPDCGSSRIQQLHQNYNTALNQNPVIDYEENLKKASIALEDMAQEISRGNGIEIASSSVTTRQQNGKCSISQNLLLSTAESLEKISHQDRDSSSAQTSSTNGFKNNKHLVKELMSREFAGTFADEEIIFESISNHKL